MTANRREWMRFAAAVSCMAGLPAFGTEASTDAAHTLEQAEARLLGVRELLARWSAISSDAEALGRRADALDLLAHSLPSACADAARVVNDAEGYGQAQSDLIEREADAVAALLASAELTRAALARVSSADVQGLAAASGACDAAFQARRDAETTCEECHAELEGIAVRMQDSDFQVSGSLERVDAESHEIGWNAESLAVGLQALQAAVEQVSGACREARGRGWIPTLPDVPAGPFDHAPVTRAALSSVARIPSSRLARSMPATGGEDHADLDTVATTLLQLDDATTYLALVGAADNAAMTSSYHDMLQRRDHARRSYELARERSVVSKDDATREARTLAAELVSRRLAFEQAAPLFPALGVDIRGTTRQVAALFAAVRPSLLGAERDATSDWSRAYAAVNGDVGVVPAPQPSPTPVFAEAPTPPALAIATPSITSHAFQYIDDTKFTLPDYGTYTYVFVRCPKDLDAPDVRKRHDCVIGLVQDRLKQETWPGHGEPPPKEPTVNLFCLPVRTRGATTPPGSIRATTTSSWGTSSAVSSAACWFARRSAPCSRAHRGRS